MNLVNLIIPENIVILFHVFAFFDQHALTIKHLNKVVHSFRACISIRTYQILKHFYDDGKNNVLCPKEHYIGQKMSLKVVYNLI